MPRDRARLSRPGREDEEVLRGDLKSCWFVRCRMLGGVGTNRDAAGEGKAVPGLLGKTEMGSPERYLQRTRTTELRSEKSQQLPLLLGLQEHSFCHQVWTKFSVQQC